MFNGGNGLAAARARVFEVEDPQQIEQPILPKGRVEAVLCVDPKLRAERKHTWRFAFDRKAFEQDEAGNAVPLHTTIARVSHCLQAMSTVVEWLRALGLHPVGVRKEEDDRMVVGLWRHPRNPPVKEAEVLGFSVKLEEIPAGMQPAYSEWMAVVEDVDAFKD